MTMRTIHYFLKPLRVLGATVVIGWSSSVALAQQPNYQLLGDGLVAFQVRPNFYVLTGAGANIALQVGTDGAVVVDAGNAESTDRVLAAIKKLTDAPIRFVFNTSDDPDHVGGNDKLARAGLSILPGAVVAGAVVWFAMRPAPPHACRAARASDRGANHSPARDQT